MIVSELYKATELYKVRVVIRAVQSERVRLEKARVIEFEIFKVRVNGCELDVQSERVRAADRPSDRADVNAMRQLQAAHTFSHNQQRILQVATPCCDEQLLAELSQLHAVCTSFPSDNAKLRRT